MRLAIIAFTRNGAAYAKQIAGTYRERGEACIACAKGKEAAQWGVEPVGESLAEWTARAFAENDALLFIGAAGIAVRAIAPLVVSKASDPAVLCMDEQGHFVISLLSGHLGGANALAREIAALVGAVPVITTATNAEGRFSVDDFARRANLYLDDLKLAKAIAAEVLEGRKIGLYSDFRIVSEIPPELALSHGAEPSAASASCAEECGGEESGLGICISLDACCNPFPQTLHLVPRIAVLGIGCRRGTSAAQIAALAEKVLAQNRLSLHSVGRVASIDLKQNEAGLLEFCKTLGVPLEVYVTQELAAVEHDEPLAESDFVKGVTGVGSVCERSALLASGQRKLLQGKVAENGVTVAIALEEYQVDFS